MEAKQTSSSRALVVSERIEAAKREADDEYKAVSTALATSKQLAAARPTTPLDSLYGEEEKDYIDGVLDDISPSKNAAIKAKWKDLQEEFKAKCKAKPAKQQFDLTPSESGPWRKGAAPMRMFMSFLQAIQRNDLDLALRLSEQILEYEPNNKVIKQYQPALLAKKEMEEGEEDSDEDSEDGWEYGDSVKEFFEEVLDEDDEQEDAVAALNREHKIKTVGDLMACFNRGEDDIQQLLLSVKLEASQIDDVKEALQEIADDEDEESDEDDDEAIEAKGGDGEYEEVKQIAMEPYGAKQTRDELEDSSKENEGPANEAVGSNGTLTDSKAQEKKGARRIGGGFEAKHALLQQQLAAKGEA